MCSGAKEENVSLDGDRGQHWWLLQVWGQLGAPILAGGWREVNLLLVISTAIGDISLMFVHAGSTDRFSCYRH